MTSERTDPSDLARRGTGWGTRHGNEGGTWMDDGFLASFIAWVES